MKKLGIIIIIAILALGAIGAGYAAWNQDLSIHGSATAATFNVTITNSGTNTAVHATTDISTFSIITVTGGGPAPIYVTIDHVIPGAVYTIPLTITDNSNIPVNFSVTAATKEGTGSDMSTWITSNPFASLTSLNASGSSAGNLVITAPDTLVQNSGSYGCVIAITASQP
jgi:hypothetical protein